MQAFRTLIGGTCILALAGCASVTPTVETTSGYAVFDIKADPEVRAAQIAEAVKTAVQRNMSKAQVINGIPPSPLPERAPRFQLTSPLKGSALGAMAAARGYSLQLPTCEGSILTVHAQEESMAKYSEGTSFFACLMPYQTGYSLNIYTTFTKASGAFSAATLGATLARSVVGDSSKFIPRTIANIVDSVKQTGATVAMTEAYP